MFVNSATGCQISASEQSLKECQKQKDNNLLLKVSLVEAGWVSRKFEQKLFVTSKLGEQVALFLVAWISTVIWSNHGLKCDIFLCS